eukprot:4407462-Prymnesium_polylepis.1
MLSPTETRSESVRAPATRSMIGGHISSAGLRCRPCIISPFGSEPIGCPPITIFWSTIRAAKGHVSPPNALSRRRERSWLDMLRSEAAASTASASPILPTSAVAGTPHSRNPWRADAPSAISVAASKLRVVGMPNSSASSAGSSSLLRSSAASSFASSTSAMCELCLLPPNVSESRRSELSPYNACHSSAMRPLVAWAESTSSSMPCKPDAANRPSAPPPIVSAFKNQESSSTWACSATRATLRGGASRQAAPICG